LQAETQPPHPAVIAHRGASGYLPEHTLEAKALAYGQGADFLEQDVVATRDGTLIVLHDIQLEPVSDVARRFPQRCRADGHFYAIDFDIDEIRQLRVTGRDSGDKGSGSVYEAENYRIPTLEEELQLISRLNRATGRQVGIYPEIKHPQWHRAHGMDLTRMLIEQLAGAGYRRYTDPVFVQCFDIAEVRRIRDELGSALRLIQLVDASQTYAQLLTRGGLAELTRYAQGLGPAYDQLVAADSSQGKARPSELFSHARDAGLLLHPYTFKRQDLPDYAPELESLLALFLGELRVDGVFCDFPDVAVAIRDAVSTTGHTGGKAALVSDGFG
jgi:glycerophosphoryl diester phosphodiesterase